MAAPVVALIPARKGSKRVINKNMQPFHGRPMAAWTLDLAESCGCFQRVFVSTDDDGLADLVADRPLFELARRPEDLANDTATVLQVIGQVAAASDLPGDTVMVLLQVTAPLRVTSDITEALRLFDLHGRRRTVVSVSENMYPPALSWTIQDDTLVPVFPTDGPAVTRKQAHAASFHWNDIVLVDTVAGFASPGRNLFGPDPVPLVCPRERGVAIDYPVQLTMAAALFPPHDERTEA
ncbi:cytidylyltransferase domain-containing protein [Magnetospirillum sp. UT-4]|uniref:acylneuraminate cytidylyltransferase family protein n=1 Tax=Magnetospirillum sp. UT-4 TaxID=2681467 RepID=UPI00137D0798|nr:NTP transferase domain-containing protein [Magnetospirillum sp. UT-4]CAA7621736.1 putative Acylneuraminate cytidylyltransferase [Magnetospirillum sp. UT-4]